MKYRRLGKTNLNISVIGIGTWQFGGEWNKTFEQDEVDAMFAVGRELGINLIDTAECYGDHLSEQFIGRAIESTRGDWILATKFGHKFNKPFDRDEPRSPADIATQLEDSLIALRTDYVDLWQYHSWGDDKFFDDDVLATALKLKDQGKIRHLGNSVSANNNVKQISASTQMDIELIQIIYNRLDQTPEDTTFPVCIEQDLGVLARVPLASGYLSGKYKPGHTFSDNEVRGKWSTPDERDEKLTRAQKIAAEEVPTDTPMVQWALAWCLQHPAVTCVIPGCKSVEQVRSNAAAASLTDMVRDDHPQAVK